MTYIDIQGYYLYIYAHIYATYVADTYIRLLYLFVSICFCISILLKESMHAMSQRQILTKFLNDFHADVEEKALQG